MSKAKTSKLYRLWKSLTSDDNLYKIIGLVVVALVLSPQLDSGYVWDDYTLSTAYGAARNHSTGLLGLLVIQTKRFFEVQGRFIPLGGIAVVLHYFTNLFFYKLSILLFCVLNLSLFSKILTRLTRSSEIGVLTILLAPAFFQVRPIPDPIIGYHAVLQLVFFWILLSVWYFLSYLEQNRLIYLIVSTTFYFFSLYTYEVSYVFPPLFFGLAFYRFNNRRIGQRLKKTILPTLPFCIAVGIVVGILLILKKLFFNGDAGFLSPTKNFFLPILCLIKHISATIPLSSSLISLKSFHWMKTIFQDFDRWNITAAVFIFILEFISVHIFIARLTRKIKIIPVTVFFLAYVLIMPGVLISLAPKYQDSYWMDWGKSYLPVYISIHGAMGLIAIILLQINNKLKPGIRTKLLSPFIAFLFSLVSVATYADTFKITNDTTISSERMIRENAIRFGLFNGIQSGYFLILNSDHYEQNPAFFRQFYDVPIKRAVAQGNYLGEPFSNPDYYFKVYFGPNAKEGFPPRSIWSTFTDSESHEKETEFRFHAKDNVFYMDTLQIVSPSDGIAILGQPHFYRATTTRIKSVTAKSILIFVQKPHLYEISALDVEIQLTRWPRSHRTKWIQTHIDSLPVIRSGHNWKIFKLNSPNSNEELDLLSFRTVIQTKP